MKKMVQGVQLDTRFNASMKRVQKAIEDLQMVADDFRDLSDAKPIDSQLAQLRYAAEDFKRIHDMMKAMKEHK